MVIILVDRVNASGGCKAAAVKGRARIGWVKFKECGVTTVSMKL